MKNKKLIKTSLNIPEYMWEQICTIDETEHTTTRTGTILNIIEKGLNWYAKKRKQQPEPEAQNAKPEQATVDQENNRPNENINQEVNEFLEELYGKEESEKVHQFVKGFFNEGTRKN